MKKNFLAFAAMGIMAGSLITGCNKTSEQKVDDAKANVGEAKQDLKVAQAKYVADWEAFKAESEQKIDANEKRIDAFNEKMEKAGSKATTKYSKEVAELKQKNSDLKKKLDDYKDEGEGKWVEFKANFSRDMDAIGKTMSDLFKDKN